MRRQPVARFSTTGTELCFQSEVSLLLAFIIPSTTLCISCHLNRPFSVIGELGAIIEGPRSTDEQNVSRYKAACQSALCTDSDPEAFCGANCSWGEAGLIYCTALWISLPLLLEVGTRLNVCSVSCRTTSEIKGE